ncbi:Ig-like domain-containing protein [Moorellaceae bacterium AZ2]
MLLSRKHVLFGVALLALVVALAVMPHPGYAFSGGSGTAADPYLISTVEDLNQVRNDLTAYYKMINDLDLSGVNWVPIGTANAPFKGTFDGGGHVIRNLYIYTDSDYAGLFGRLNNATVKDLGFESAQVQGGRYTAVLAGYVDGSSITGVNVKDSRITSSSNSYTIGGLVGYTPSSSISNAYVSNTYVAGSQVSGRGHVGGLVGLVSNGSISNAYVADSQVSGCGYVAGLVGWVSDGSISNVYVSNIYAVGIDYSDTYDGVGGLVASQYKGSISNTYVVGGQISGSTEWVGGLVGYLYGSISNSYAAVSVSGGKVNRGGLVASRTTDSTAIYSYWDTQVSGTTNSVLGTGYPTEKMKQRTTYANWDFVNVWAIEEGISYPWLRTLPKPKEVGGTPDLQISSISVLPDTLSLQVNQSAQITVTAHYSDGSTEDATSQASFVSSDPSVATVNGNIVKGISKGTAMITVTCFGKTATIPVTVTEAAVTRIDVSPSPVVVIKDGSQQLRVIATYSDGSTKDVTGVANYQVGDSSIATVNSGLVQGLAAGSTNLTVTYQGQTATVPVTVVEPSTTVKQTGDIIVLKVPQHLQPVTYNSAADFTVTENGVDVPVIRVEVKEGTDGWPFSEVWLYLHRPVTVGSDVVVRYNPDPNYPLIPIDGDTVSIPATPVINQSTVPLTLERSTVVVQPGGDVVYITFPTKVKVVEYQGNAGYTVYSSGTPIQVTRVVTDGNGAYLYLEHPVPQGEAVTISYTPVQGQEITTVAGTPLSATTTPVSVENRSTFPVVIYEPPVVSEDGRTVVISVPAELQDVIYEGNAGFRVFVGDREIPVVKVEMKDNKIILYLGAPLVGGEVPTIEYVPVDGQPIETVNRTPVSGFDNLRGNNQSTLSLDSITVEPASVNLAEGATGKLTVTAHYSDGSAVDVTTLASYQVDNSLVAMVSNGGVVTGVKAGSANITVTYGGKTATVPVEVTAKASVLTGLTVTPNSVSVAKGRSQQVVVTAAYSDGSTKDVTGDVTYEVGDSSVISVSGGLVQGLAEGNTILIVTYQGKSVQVPVTVTAPVVESLMVEPAQVSLPKGKTQQLKVTAILSDGTRADVTGEAAYNSSDTEVATVSADGKVYGTGTGSATVSITYGGKTVHVPVEVTQPVVETLSVEPSSVTLAKGKSQQLAVRAMLSDGSMIDVTSQAAYSSANTDIAVVSAGGSVSGVGEGNTTVTVSYQGKSVDVLVVVSAPTVEALTVEPQSVSLPKGKTQQFKVTATLSDGSTVDVTAQASYGVANPAVASVSADGKVIGVGEGNTMVTVSYGGRQVSVSVTVAAPVVEALDVEPAQVNIAVGKTQQLTVKAMLSDGTVQDVTAPAAYASGNSSIAVVAPGGQVTGNGTGNTTVTVSYGGKQASVPVVVTAPVMTGLKVEPASVTLEIGQSQQLKVTAQYSDGSTRDVTAEASYNSSNNAVALVSAGGLVTAVKDGACTVTVNYQGRSASVPVTVKAPAVVQTGVSVSPNPVVVNKYGSVRLTVVVIYSNGSTQDVTTYAQYTSADTSIATVKPNGVVYGKRDGQTEVIVTYNGNTYRVPVKVGNIPVVGLERSSQQQPVVVYPEQRTSGEPVVVYPSR